MSDKFERLRKALKESTPVNGWYAHKEDMTVRGPYNRWFRITDKIESEWQGNRKVRAHAEDDIEYASAAMTDVPELLSAYDAAQFEVASIKKHYSDTIDRMQAHHDNVTKMYVDEISDLKEKLRVAVEKFELIRDAPALGALDYRSEKRWRKGTMETIKHIATDALTKIKGTEK